MEVGEKKEQPMRTTRRRKDGRNLKNESYHKSRLSS